ENGLQGKVLGLICDGTGWGTDAAIWGGEILRGDYNGFTRLAHLKYMPLPGGDVTAGKPYRMALVYLYQSLGDKGLELASSLLADLTEQEKSLIIKRINNAHEPLTSSCGRLFDAVGAILGVCSINKYEGQAPAELEARADKYEKNHYEYYLKPENGVWLMDVLPMWRELVDDLHKGRSIGCIAQKFHLTLAEMFLDVLLKLRDTTGLNQVVLGGGVFHNQILFIKMYELLTSQGFAVYYNRLVPPGDGGISLGQAIIASEVKG
ncbi:MAG: carbamoyltransferase HypF, partial [Syntrophomonadaceae bacterium]|nr:carbamoyltransferase HypF [Syntrophomonadaceae bacterium]